MRRYFFYLAVAVVAFGVGIVAVINFYWSEGLDTTKSIVESVKPLKAEEQKSEVLETQAESNSEELISEEEFYENPEPFLKPFIKRWLRGEKIEEKLLSARTFEEAKGPAFNNFLPSLTDVNSDGKKELAIQYACSPTGNCEFMIYQKIGKSYRRILKAVHGVQIFSFRKNTYGNYKDIETRMHGSANTGDGGIYRFNGEEYKPISCFEYVYERFTDKNGEIFFRNTPTFYYYRCKF